MTANLETALSRLRNADPAAATPLDARGEDRHARAILTEILRASGDRAVAVPNRTRRRAHRLALAGAVVAALALSAVAGVVSMPWSHGRVSSAAYAVTKHADGTVGVTIHWNQLRHPDALNARLRRAGVRAAVMLYSAPGQCRTPVRTDPAYTIMRLDLRQHPELANNPRALAAYLRSQTPWLDRAEQPGNATDVSVLTIHPDAIPRGDQLLILPSWDRPEGATNEALALGSLIVPALPPCVPGPADSVMTRNGIQPR